MTTKQQSGFGVVPIISIVAVVAILGLLGFKMLTMQSSKPTANSVANNQTSPASSQPSSSQTSATPAQADTYLHIKELGIKIKLSDDIKDVVYKAGTGSDGGQFAQISTQSLTDQSNGACGVDAAPFGTITKASGSPEHVFGGTSRTVDNKTTFKFGTDTYVFLSGPQAACSDSATLQYPLGQRKSEFFDAFKTVQLDN